MEFGLPREGVVVRDALTLGQGQSPEGQVLGDARILAPRDEKVDHVCASGSASGVAADAFETRRAERDRSAATLMSPVTLSSVLNTSGMVSTASRITMPSIEIGRASCRERV